MPCRCGTLLSLDFKYLRIFSESYIPLLIQKKGRKMSMEDEEKCLVHLEDGFVYKLTKCSSANGVTYYRCSHFRTCEKRRRACLVTGIKREGSPIVVCGRHTCGQPVKVQPTVDLRVRERVNDLAKNKNYSSIEIATEVQKQFSGRLDEDSSTYLRPDLFLDSIKETQKSFRDPAYQEQTILTSSQGLPDPFTHVPVDRTSKDIFYFYKERLDSFPDELKLFADDTFQSVPSPFASCLNIMGYDSNRGGGRSFHSSTL